MREDTAIVQTWRLSETVRLEADGEKTDVVIQIPGGPEVRGEVPDPEAGSRAMRQACAWNLAVYPDGGSRFAAPMRARAWNALTAAGEDRPNAAKITRFLGDWESQEPGEGIEKYAATWRRLRYAC